MDFNFPKISISNQIPLAYGKFCQIYFCSEKKAKSSPVCGKAILFIATV